ncbi:MULTISPECIES: type IVB secretion system protein IcmH/DotU [unclassified Pseudovibrio]|uniref:type IVB secretion system protein IcmH/DotU n=1 Tax=unclassified Pseudovibrio TaxID=2627060 RepID=UPI001AD9256F|nr:type IVB secretion system protein IcmH/DotU [Pseudovibrio sp. FO-BEG1]
MSEVANLFDASDPEVAEDVPVATAESVPQNLKDVSPRPVQHISFPMRGHSINKIIDASQSLLALISRIPEVSENNKLDYLHKDVRAEIESLELELQREGFDRATILAHRYCLCSAIDEAVMCSPWGQNSDWSERSLLALFHSETWGGEKFFIVLSRLMRDPVRYIELIEFLYVLLGLGFEGKYRVMHNGKLQLEEIMRDVRHIIRQERGEGTSELGQSENKIIEKAHVVHWHTPVSLVWISLFILCALTYVGFYWQIDQYTDGVVTQLREML